MSPNQTFLIGPAAYCAPRTNRAESRPELGFASHAFRPHSNPPSHWTDSDTLPTLSLHTQRAFTQRGRRWWAAPGARDG